jgi:NAD(P)-dependent dehydrogenase (short-subunit alcohol dehydrogenase family)
MTSGSEDANFVEQYSWDDPFWTQPIEVWDSMMTQGSRSAYVSSLFAAREMTNQESGLIVNITIVSPATAKNLAYASSHVVVNHLTQAMSSSLRPHGVTVVSLYPGNVFPENENRENAESSIFVGRAVAALATDSKVFERTGNCLGTGQLSKEYEFTDLDGSNGTDWSKM